MWRNYRASLLLLGGSVALTLVLLEFATRLVYADLATTGDNTSYFARRWYAANPPRRNHLGFREREFAPLPAGGPSAFLVDQVLGVCREHGWRCVDLRPSLAGAMRAEELRVDAFDGHPNALANALAARAVLDELGPAWAAGARAGTVVARRPEQAEPRETAPGGG